MAGKIRAMDSRGLKLYSNIKRMGKKMKMKGGRGRKENENVFTDRKQL